MDQQTDIERTLQNLTKLFVEQELNKKFNLNMDGIEKKPIKHGDCSVFLELADKIKGNVAIMNLYDETEETFDPIAYIFDHILYYYFDSFDLVSSYEGHYTEEYNHASSTLNSGLRLLIKADYYDNWARKIDGKTVPARNPQYLVVEHSPEYLEKILPRKTRIYKVNDMNVREHKYRDALAELSNSKSAELTVRFWDESQNTYSKEVNVMVEFHKNENSREISYTHLKLGQNIAYIQIPTFLKQNLEKELFKSWIEYIQTVSSNSQGTIIDLRNNGGGRAYEAAKILGTILPENAVISHYIQKNPVSNAHELKSNTIEDHFPIHFGKIIVLINSHSASASEVFAQAIKDYRAGIVVGERSIGKGIGQNSLQIAEPHLQGEASLTNFYVFSPRGDTWYQRGVIPDIEVLEPSQQRYAWNFSDVAKSLPNPYPNKPNVNFDADIDIRNKVSEEVIVKLRDFKKDSANEPSTCKKSVDQLTEEESCILSWGVSIMQKWIELEPETQG
ncbi:MAG: S41 family peptidase [Bdellovibrionota bacterium]